MILSALGKFLENEWLKTPEVRADMNIILDKFVIMPDHFHAIIIIGKNRYNTNYDFGDVRRNAMNGRNAMHGRENDNF